MSIKFTTGTKKKVFNSLKEAARKVAEKTGEPENRVYMRMYMRRRAGKPAATVMYKPARQYTIRQMEVTQMEVTA